MIGVEIVLVIIYILLIGIFAFIMVYPLFRDFCLDFFSSKGSGEVVAVCSTLMAIGYGLFIMYYLIASFIAIMALLISIFSGLEYIYLSRSFKVNLALFIVSSTLRIWSFIINGVSSIISLIQGTFYLIGVGEGAYKHLLPLAEDFSGKFDPQSYAKTFVAIFILICILTIFLDWFGVGIPPYLEAAPDISDAGFIIGGLIGYLIKRFYKSSGATKIK